MVVVQHRRATGPRHASWPRQSCVAGLGNPPQHVHAKHRAQLAKRDGDGIAFALNWPLLLRPLPNPDNGCVHVVLVFLAQGFDLGGVRTGRGSGSRGDKLRKEKGEDPIPESEPARSGYHRCANGHEGSPCNHQNKPMPPHPSPSVPGRFAARVGHGCLRCVSSIPRMMHQVRWKNVRPSSIGGRR